MKVISYYGTASSAPSQTIGVNINDVGEDIILAIGQSNNVGYGTGIDTNLDFSNPRINSYAATTGSGNNAKCLELSCWDVELTASQVGNEAARVSSQYRITLG